MLRLSSPLAPDGHYDASVAVFDTPQLERLCHRYSRARIVAANAIHVCGTISQLSNRRPQNAPKEKNENHDFYHAFMSTQVRRP
jgi:argonaute-like protein implicated in RNA metabolism and viral defense